MTDTNTSYKNLVGKIFATGVMSFCGVVSETAMNVAFPTLMNEFDVGTNTVQWITTGYLLVLALVITMSSYLKRNFSQRTQFIVAITCFISATLACCVAPSFAVLMIGRMVQGVGTGIALPLMFNIIMSEAPKEKIGTFMGVGMLVTAIAPAVGPLLGGSIVDMLGWRYIFLSLMPFLLLSTVIGCRLIKGGAPQDHSHFHVFDYSLIVVGYTCFILAMVQASTAGWVSVEVLSLLAVAVIALGWFVHQAKKEDHPLLRVEVLGYRNFMCALVVILIIQFDVLALGYVLPNYSQLVNHTGALLAGSLMVPGCIVGAIVSPLSGRLLDKVGARLPIILSMSLMLVSLVLFTCFGEHLTTPMFYVFYVIFTIGQGLGCGNTLTFGLSQLPKDLSSDGNALINSFQQLAGAMGTAVIASIVAASQLAMSEDFSHATAVGSREGFVLLAILMLAALIISLIMTKSKEKQ